MAIAKLHGSTAIAKIDGVPSSRIAKREGSSWSAYVVPLGWNSSDCNAGITITGGKTVTAGAGSSWQSVRASTSKAGLGKYYCELTYVSKGSGANTLFGLSDSWMTLSQYVGQTTRSFGWFSTANQYYRGGSSYAAGLSYTTGDVVMIALDFDSSKIWFGKNGTWNGSGNPETGDNPAFTAIGTGALFPAVSVLSGAIVVASFATEAFAYTPPSGFSPF